LLAKYSLDQWSRLDIEAEGIEGVSGATMTSIAVAESIARAAKKFEADVRHGREERAKWLTGLWRVIGTTVVVIAGMAIGLTSLRGKGWLRTAFQGLVIIYLGFINGDLVSLALLVGWAQNGVPWQNALGLVILVVAALSLPIATRTNVYCSHLCPHGAAQQLLPRRWKQQAPMNKTVLRWLVWIRPLLLVWVLLVTMMHWSFSLVDIEPFDAYSWRAATWPTILVAVVGLLASLRIPMAYCRFGCGTGAVLQFVRRHSRSDRLTSMDLFAFACFAASALLYFVHLPA
jgi:polyferredoxin